jgi:pyridoxal phosphate enzyme (YggS family)
MTTEGAPSIRLRFEEVRNMIAAAAARANRDPATVSLVAVTKKVDLSTIRAAVEVGHRDFGENYVQEGLGKIEALSDPSVRWHLIGSLQSNKAARAARAFWLLHSVTSRSVAEAISRQMAADGQDARVLIQVKLAAGGQRAGVEADEVAASARMITAMPGLLLDGVMGVAPLGEPARPSFARLAAVLEDLRRLGLPRAPLTHMSAGMSADFSEAIAEGATIVRIGTAIFGDRP